MANVKTIYLIEITLTQVLQYILLKKKWRPSVLFVEALMIPLFYTSGDVYALGSNSTWILHFCASLPASD